MKPRKLVFYLHLVCGLAAGALLTSAGLTGSVLVWREEIDHLLHPELLQVQQAGTPVPLERVVAAVESAYPGERALRIQLARAPGETHEVTTAGADPLQVYVDPYRATVLGARRPDETFTNWLFHLHSKLLSGETGERVMGSAALLLLVLVLSGVVVWWPGVRRVRDALRVKWGANWKRVNFDLHRAGGIWTAAFLTMAAVTGGSLVFHDAFMAGLNRVTASPPRPAAPSAPPLGGPTLPLDELVARGIAPIPGARPTYLTLPLAPGAPAVVRARVDAELHPNGRNFAYLHPESGELLALEAAMTAPAGTRAYNVLYPVHIGRWGGLASKLLYSLLGLTPALLSISGALMWWNRSGRRLLGRPGRATAAPARTRTRPARVA